MDDPDSEHYAPTPGLELVKGVLSHAAEGGRNRDHIVEVVDVRRAHLYAELLLKTPVEVPDYDLDTRTRCCGRLRRCLYVMRQAAKSWQREIEKGIDAAGMVIWRSSQRIERWFNCVLDARSSLIQILVLTYVNSGSQVRSKLFCNGT